MYVYSQEATRAIAFIKSLSSQSWHLFIVAFGFSTGSRNSDSRPRHYVCVILFFSFSFLVSSVGIEHSNKRLNWSSSSLVSQTLGKNILIYNISSPHVLGRCSPESVGDVPTLFAHSTDCNFRNHTGSSIMTR